MTEEQFKKLIEYIDAKIECKIEETHYSWEHLDCEDEGDYERCKVLREELRKMLVADE